MLFTKRFPENFANCKDGSITYRNFLFQMHSFCKIYMFLEGYMSEQMEWTQGEPDPGL